MNFSAKAKSWKSLALILALLTLPACGQHLAGTAYKVQVGRSTSELFQQGTFAWQAGAELRLETNRCGGCHGSILRTDQGQVRI